MRLNKLTILFILSLFFTSAGFAQNTSFQKQEKEIDIKYLSPTEQAEYLNKWNKRMSKVTGARSRANARSIILSGNQVQTIIYDYGSISKPGLAAGQLIDLAWPKDPSKAMGYGYEFGPLVGAQVKDTTGQTIRVVDDGFIYTTDGSYDPGADIPWGWMPTPGYVDSTQSNIATYNAPDANRDGKPDSWPESWWNSTLRRYVWPAFLGNDATTPDEEAYWVMDDYQNAKPENRVNGSGTGVYLPFPNDPTKRGLGLSMECRAFQYNNPLAEDIVFFVYSVKNMSPKNLDTAYFGMFGDPHIGGSNDYDDDCAGFITPFDYKYQLDARNLLYAYDQDGKAGSPFSGRKTGYFGYKFLESPTNSNNYLDDDGDGIIDESPYNDAGTYLSTLDQIMQGIGNLSEYTKNYSAPKTRWSGDEDGDWDPKNDDLGQDGIPGTNDFGEGNGRPDQGEPNFGLRDVHELDNIGLTSFNAYIFGGTNRPNNHTFIWQCFQPNLRDTTIQEMTIEQRSDNVFIYGSGPFVLNSGQTQRFSIALLFGESLEDLVLNSITSQQIWRANYQFAQPPRKPTVRIIAGDHKVTLYWDTKAEESIDPLSRKNDFEGYKIYRSANPTFSDVFSITDGNGNPYLGVPLIDAKGVKAQWDVVNEYKGFSALDYPMRGIKYYLGNNTGLVHSFVDTPVTNGKTYYYALVSYDHGDTGKVNVPPSETQHEIKKDAVTGILSFDINTGMAVPNPKPSDYVNPKLDNIGGNTAERISGVSTGKVQMFIMEDTLVRNKTYDIDFASSNGTVSYNVRDLLDFTDYFVGRDTMYSNLNNTNIVPGTLKVKDLNGGLVSADDFIVDYEKGSIKGKTTGKLKFNQAYQAIYQYYPVYGSTLLSNEDGNKVFDGIKIKVVNDPNQLDVTKSGWKSVKTCNLPYVVENAKIGTPKVFRGDFELRWNSTELTSDGKNYKYPGDSSITKVECPFVIMNVRDNLKAKFFIGENAITRNNRWDVGESIVVLDPDRPGNSNTTYQVILNKKVDTVNTKVDTNINGRDTSFIRTTYVDKSILPGNGDIFQVLSLKSFMAGDKYKFKTVAGYIDNNEGKGKLDNVYVVPNPYVVFGEGELADPDPTRRGEKRLEFRNLPNKCTIRIYTITGEKIREIVKDDMNSYSTWNLLTSEGQSIAYGVYIFHVDAPGIGKKIGRFAVIK
jgi:hypothetical protein